MEIRLRPPAEIAHDGLPAMAAWPHGFCPLPCLARHGLVLVLVVQEADLLSLELVDDVFPGLGVDALDLHEGIGTDLVANLEESLRLACLPDPAAVEGPVDLVPDPAVAVEDVAVQDVKLLVLLVGGDLEPLLLDEAHEHRFLGRLAVHHVEEVEVHLAAVALVDDLRDLHMVAQEDGVEAVALHPPERLDLGHLVLVALLLELLVRDRRIERDLRDDGAVDDFGAHGYLLAQSLVTLRTS